MFLSKLFNHFKQKTYASAVNEPISIGMSFGKKAIFAGNVPQSGGEFIHEWNTVIKLVNDKQHELDTCLMLGVAGGSAINSLRKYYPGIKILGIEIDPVIVKVALDNNLFMRDARTKLTIADAISWIKTEKKKYDLIVVDLYYGDTNVLEAREELFLKRVRERLTSRGIVLYSCHYREQEKKDYEGLIKLLKKMYASVEVVFEFPKNKILLFKK